MIDVIVVIIIWYILGLIGAFLFGKLPDEDLNRLETKDCFLVAVGGVAILGFGIGELFYYIFIYQRNSKKK